MAAKFGLTIFVVLVATQVFPSSGSCVYPAPACGAAVGPCGSVAVGPVGVGSVGVGPVSVGSYGVGGAIAAGSAGTYVTGPAPASSGVYYSSGAAPSVYLPSGAAASQTVYYPGSGALAPLPASDCSVPPVFLPPPKFPTLPTIHAPNPLTIPLQVPSVIPVGKVCVCKSIQIQPSVIPVQKPISACACKPACLPVPTC